VNRREFLLSPALLFSGRDFFREILDGYLRNCRATSNSYAVCDFPGGTKLKNCMTPGGKTYVSVARMLPAMVSYRGPEIAPVLLSIFRNAFDPAHPDYWGEPPADKPDQRQVEAALVAWSLWRLGDGFAGQLTAHERTHVQKWLASCTAAAERKRSHAWFSAINHAARLSLSQKWKEFHGDERWMLEDLKALDSMATAGDGWYADSLTQPIFDYNNFWNFASYFLQWNQIAGARHPHVAVKFRERLQLFLKNTPYFFAANGSHVLYGRSLIYRWASLTPLVQAHEQGLWPHSAGLLRRIVRKSLEYHRSIGSYDAMSGKLRETYSAEGCPDVMDFYCDNGHPYWAMQAYSFLALPQTDPFWNAVEEPLPIERADFRVRFDGPRMWLAGDKRSGQVRWIQAQGTYPGIRYRDKYIKFSYSSHFPLNVNREEKQAPWDAALVFRNPHTGNTAARAGIVEGKLLDDGVRIAWWTELDGRRIEVATEFRFRGEFELRRHEVKGAEGFEALEGSAALGFGRSETIATERAARAQIIRGRNGAVATWMVEGYQGLEKTEEFFGRTNLNVIHARSAINTLRVAPVPRVLASLHYASPKPLSFRELNTLVGASLGLPK
jgi:hypothetical protein